MTTAKHHINIIHSLTTLLPNLHIYKLYRPQLGATSQHVRSCAFLLSHAVAMVAAGAKPCRTMQLGLPFAYCAGWETIKAAAVLLAAVIAAEYKTNDHFVRRSSLSMAGQHESRSPEVNLKRDFS